MLLLMIPVLYSVKKIRFLFCTVFQYGDNKIIRIVRIAGLLDYIQLNHHNGND